MKPNKSDYRIILSKDCIRYIEQKGIGLNDYNLDYSIPSKSGLIYTLPNGEFILMPSNFDESYPSIIFSDAESFKKYLAIDSFPIGAEYMTWLETYSSKMKTFFKLVARNCL